MLFYEFVYLRKQPCFNYTRTHPEELLWQQDISLQLSKEFSVYVHLTSVPVIILAYLKGQKTPPYRNASTPL